MITRRQVHGNAPPLRLAVLRHRYLVGVDRPADAAYVHWIVPLAVEVLGFPVEFPSFHLPVVRVVRVRWQHRALDHIRVDGQRALRDIVRLYAVSAAEGQQGEEE